MTDLYTPAAVKSVPDCLQMTINLLKNYLVSMSKMGFKEG